MEGHAGRRDSADRDRAGALGGAVSRLTRLAPRARRR
jgi:hypothetical protein